MDVDANIVIDKLLDLNKQQSYMIAVLQAQITAMNSDPSPSKSSETPMPFGDEPT